MAKKILLGLLVFCLPAITFAARYPEVSCGQYGSQANGCDQCFDGGAKYVGDTFTPDDYFRAGSQTRVFWQDENWTRYQVNVLNGNTNWYVSNDLIGYPPTFLWYTAQNGSNAGRKYHLFTANTNERFYSTKTGKGIRLQSVNGDNVDPNKPAMKFTFIANYHDFLGAGRQGPKKTHKECVFYKPRYCGDGILQTGKGEVCDPRDPLQRGWGNGGCNTNTCRPVNTPACNSLTVSPNNGEAPLDVSATCSGYKVSSFKIDCGNGQEFTKTGGNSGTETFTATCNYTAANTYTPRCFVNGTLSGNTCQKTVTVTEPVNPSIIVDKRDQNIFDTDGTVGDDTQTVAVGTDAVFKIRVTNNGAEPLRDISLIDARADACATKAGTVVNLAGSQFTNINNATVAINYGGAGNHTNNTLEVNEWFEYICKEPNTQAGYTNTVEVRGTGVTSGKNVDDTDPTVILIDSNSGYDLALRKTLSSATPGPFNTGDTVTFQIEVFNQGRQDASNIEVTDYIPTGLTLNDSNWTLSGNRATRQIPSTITPGNSEVVTITFTIDADAPKTIKNLAEISNDNGDDCDSTPDNDATNDGLITDNAIGVACEPGGDEDDHDIEEITIQNSSDDDYDLALRKTLVGSQTTFSVGDSVTFNIEVINQGEVDAANIVVTDYIPTGLTLNDANWTQSGNNASRVVSSLLVGQTSTLTITFTLNASATGTIRNIAEISSDDGTDCDSTTDTNSTNDNLVDDAIGTRCDTSTTDEDDHDIAEITVGTVTTSACTNLTASPSSAQGSLTSTLTCTGSGATSYLLEVRNSSNSVVFSNTNASASVTLNNQGTYTASCFVNGETTTANSCQKTLTVTGGGGGLSPLCNDVIQDGNQITCVGNRKVNAFMLRCGTGTGSTVLFDTTPDIINSSRREATFTCNAPVAECLVNDVATNDETHSRWKARSSDVCTTDKIPYCGDGVLDSEAGEKCDFGAASDWGKCYKPPHAKACTFKNGGGGGGGGCDPEREICNVITLPNDGELVFGPAGEVVVGHGKNPLDQTGSPYLFNNSAYDLSFNNFCVKRTETDTVGAEKALESGNVTGEYCVNIGHEVIYGYERIELDDYAIYPNYTGNKNGIPSGAPYGKAKLKTSIKADVDNNGTIEELYNSYLSSELRVRVAKPAVVTTGGGVSFIKNSNTTGDVEKVTTGVSGFDQNTNKNFVGTSASNSAISSHADSIDESSDSAGVDKIEAEKDTYEQAVDSVTQTTTTVVGNSIGYGDFENYNGLENVYIITGKNVTVANIPSLSKPTTYIIEGGDLRITGNIESNQNVAFVVKGGDIIISETVDTLNGTYISIPTASGGGHINGGADTDTQLVVNGSLYGDISGLVLTRHYISNDSGQLGVGTIVSFGSSLFTKPAPLVGQFIGEYLEAEKIAK